MAIAPSAGRAPELASYAGGIDVAPLLGDDHPLLRADTPISVADTGEAAGGARSLRAFVAVPMRASDGALLGVLGVADWEPRSFGSDVTSTLASLARLASTTLATEREIAQCRRENRVHALVREVARQLTETGSANELIQNVLERVCSLLGWSLGHASLTHPSEPSELIASPLWHVAEPQRFRELRDDVLARRFQSDAGIVGRVFRSGKPEWASALCAEDLRCIPGADQAGISSALAVPMVARDRTVGVLAFFGGGTQPDPECAGALGELGRLAGRALDRERGEAERIKVETQLRAVIETAQDAFVSIDAAGVVREWNRAAERTFGWSRAEALGRRVAELIVPHEERDAHARGLEQFLETGHGALLNKRVELIAVGKDEHEFPVELTVTPMQLQNEYVFNAFVHDISERKQNERDLREREWAEMARAHAEAERSRLEEKAAELAELTRELERRNRDLDQFAYVASHDLRAPLRGIANLAVWIDEDLAGVAKGETREHLQLLRDRVKRMEALIDGLLSYSRAGRACETERVAVRELVEEVVELLAPPEHVRVEIAGDLPVIEAPRLPLRQVFQNLIGNALKHNTRPDPQIRVGAERRDAEYEFFVADNGTGIPAEYHTKIWGLFQKLESPDRVEGTGIGLALVKKIVESAGGRAWLDSEPGSFCVFRFTWPALRVHTPLPR